MKQKFGVLCKSTEIMGLDGQLKPRKSGSDAQKRARKEKDKLGVGNLDDHRWGPPCKGALLQSLSFGG